MNEPFDRSEADQFIDKIKEELFSLFEGANEIFEVFPCGSYRRGDEKLKDMDILITRNDGGPCKYILMKLIETLEDKGLIV